MKSVRSLTSMLLVIMVMFLAIKSNAYSDIQPYGSSDFKPIAHAQAPTGVACFAMVFNYFGDQGLYTDVNTGQTIDLRAAIGPKIEEGSMLWDWINGTTSQLDMQQMYDAAYCLNAYPNRKAQYIAKMNNDYTGLASRKERRERFDELLNDYLVQGVPVIIQMRPLFAGAHASYVVVTGYDFQSQTVYYASPVDEGFSATVSYDDFIAGFFYQDENGQACRWDGCWLAFYQGDLPPGDYSYSFYLENFKRTYALHVPGTYTGSEPLPLVLDFHGIYQSAATEKKISGFAQQAEEKGFIVAYPEGLGLFGVESLLQSWNADTNGAQSMYSWANAIGVDDVAFAAEVVNDIKRQLNIDAQRVYVAGISQGGAMALLCAHERGDIFASVAAISTELLMGLDDYNPLRPISVLNIHSYEDNIVPYFGNSATGIAPIEDAVHQWATVNCCVPEPFIDSFMEEYIDLEPFEKLTKYTGGQDGVEVWMYSLHANSDPHNVYRNNYHGATKDEKSQFIAQLAWEFFEKFPMP